jgi:uncharacterized protein YkwD
LKAIILFCVCAIAMAACGTSAQAGTQSTVTVSAATSTPGELPTIEPSPTPSEAVSPTTTPSPTPVDSATIPSPTTLPTQECINKAAFSEDITIPDGMLIHMGDKFTKTWRIRNAGTCTWAGYELVYAGGEAMNGPMSNSMPEVKPDDYANVSVELQAPQRGGGVTGYWHFQDAAGQTFGVGAEGDGLLWVQINVDYPPPVAGTPVSAGSTPVASTTNTSSAATPETSQSGCVYTRNSDYESQILGLINNVRTQNGLGTLSVDSRLTAAALEHSLDMACNAIISHTGTDGSTWYTRVSAQGFANYNSARENIYVGNPAFGGDAQGAFTWWMNSEIHRKTLMNPDAKLIGIAYVYSDASAYGGNYTTVFARP